MYCHYTFSTRILLQPAKITRFLCTSLLQPAMINIGIVIEIVKHE